MVNVLMDLLEIKPEKAMALKQALFAVAQDSKNKPAYLEYRVHRDNNNVAQFVFYEKWTSKEFLAEQFKKPYILAFAAQLDDLLVKPYQLTLA